MKHLDITVKDIVKSMDDETKHNLANHCILNKVYQEEVIQPICNIANETINFAIDLCNAYFESPAGKEYLNMRKKIDYLGR